MLKIPIYVIKAARNIRETSPYVRKVGCVFLVKEGLKNGDVLLLRKKVICPKVRLVISEVKE